MGKQGIMDHMVDTHFLQYGVVMAIKLLVKSDTLITNFGQWSSLNFLQYIHEQIDHLSKGVSTDTSNQYPFTTMGQLNANPLTVSFTIHTLSFSYDK